MDFFKACVLESNMCKCVWPTFEYSLVDAVLLKMQQKLSSRTKIIMPCPMYPV